VVLTEPVTDNQSYGEAIGQPGDVDRRRQTHSAALRGPQARPPQHWNRIHKGYIRPTLTNVVCGDIAMALPERILTNLIEGLNKLNQVVPGVSNDETLLYAPEIKFFATQMKPAMISKPPSPVFTSPATGPVSPETSSQRPPPA